MTMVGAEPKAEPDNHAEEPTVASTPATPPTPEATPTARKSVAKKKPVRHHVSQAQKAKAFVEEKPPKPVEVWQPVTHAKEAGVTTCLHSIEDQSKKTIDIEHTAASSWSRSAPNDKPFLSAIGMRYNNQVAPNLFTFMYFVPTGGECVGQVTQVYPTQRTCPEIEKQLLDSGKKVGELAAISYIESADGTRIALIPGPAASCTVVSVHRT